LVRRADRRAAEPLRLAGSTLRRLHDAALEPTTTLDTRTVRDEIAEVERTTATIQQLAPPIGTVVRDLLVRSRDALARLPAEAPVLVHGDYKADHLLCGQDALTLIDFDRCAVADPALDLAKFLADLRWWLAGRSPHVLVAAHEQFLAGYGPTSRARLTRALALEPLFAVKLAARRVQVHQPRWDQRTRAFVAHADRLLQERTRR
jgi:aminoglycoside phosphotransferase (APT) family kinase protein